jgi:cytoskeletal protein CcmA (bactofilin family)
MWKRDQSITPPTARQDQPTERAPADSRSTEKLVLDLGRSVVIKGELSGSEDLTLSGYMEGSITLPVHTLTIGPHAEIKTQVSAKSVVVMGAVTGNVTAGERVETLATGSVIGDIVSPRLAIEDGCCLHGRVEMPRGGPDALRPTVGAITGTAPAADP